MTIALLIMMAAAGFLLIRAWQQPDTFRIVRMRFIVAPPARVFPLLNSPREASRWSPFEKDPAMHKIYSGPDSGVGAKMTWQGNNQVGAGDIEITQSVPDRQVVLRLRMTRPMKANNEVVYELESVDGGTEVTWTMSGPQPFIGKLLGVVIDLERKVGGEFEKGLATLKSLAEKQPD